MNAAYDAYCRYDENKMRQLLNDVTEQDVLALSDTLQYCFYYCNAGLMSSDDKADKALLLDYINKAIHLREKSLVIRHSEYLELLWAKGSELEDSDPAAATKVYQRGIIVGQGIVNKGNDAINHWFGQILANLGNLYQKRGYIDQAISLYREGFSLLSQGYIKDETPDAWIALFSLQLLYYDRQNYQEAIKVNDELLNFFAEHDGRPSRDYADILYFKGNCLNKSGQVNAAIDCYNEGIEMLRGINQYDEKLESLYSNLYMTYVANYRLADAESLIIQAKDFLVHFGKPNNICNYYFSGAQTLLDAGKYEDAERLAMRCEPFIEELSPLARTKIFNTLAVSRLKQNNGKDALQPLTKIDELYHQCNATESIEYAINLHNLGRANMLIGNTAKAIELLTTSKTLQIKLAGDVSEQTRKYLTELGVTE